MLLKGKAMLEDAAAMGRAVETAFFKHVYTRYYGPMSMGFSYWRSKKDEEVDIIVEHQDQLIPFEVKYSFQHTGLKELKGLLALCEKRNISRGYVITREPDDFEILETSTETNLLKIPAVLACYWLGQSELRTAKTDVDAG